jgi:hypothetical protein
MEATRRLFLTAGLAGVPSALIVQQLNAQRRGPGPQNDSAFLSAIGHQLAAQARAAQAGGALREIARSFTTTLRLHAAYLRQSNGDAAWRDRIRNAKSNGHWQHALDSAGDPQARERAIEECQRRFGVDLRQFSPGPARQSTRDDMERFATMMLGGVSIADQLDRLAGLLDDASSRMPGNLNVRFDQSYDQWCQDGVCQIVWVLEQIWAAACSVGWMFGEPGLIACAAAFVEWEMARFFTWLIGCNC